MNKHTYLLEFRVRLDEAITYGSKAEALKLAKQYLKEAEDREHIVQGLLICLKNLDESRCARKNW